MAALLSGAICLLGATFAFAQTYNLYNLDEYEKATGKKIETLHEAPILSVKVAAGELPPVEERLPENPMVVEPCEEIGKYGGTLNVVAVSDMWNVITSSRFDKMLTTLEPDGEKIIGSIAEGFEWSEGKKSLTLHLRKGLKFSDGYPFTVDDILFMWEDVTLNENITPLIPNNWKPGGKLMQYEKVDDYTLRLDFAVPYPQWTRELTVPAWGGDQPWATVGFYAPKHYLKRFHIKYNPKADELAKEAGFEHWWELFKEKHDPYSGVNYPTLSAWVCTYKEEGKPLRIYERNPYYWAVDPAGNQLPYLDKGVVNIVGNRDLYNMKLIAGQADFAFRFTAMENYALYKKNEDKGNYRVFPWSTKTGRVVLFFNQNHKDPVEREIYQDIRFRQAMSLAMDREEINKVLYFGLAKPTQCVVANDEWSFYQEWWEDYYAEYDAEKANQLLDEVGLDKKDKEGCRLRSDGKRLEVIIEFTALPSLAPELDSLLEMIKEYWENVGVKTILKEQSGIVYSDRRIFSLMDVYTYVSGGASEKGAYISVRAFRLGLDWDYLTLWGLWMRTDGKEGMKPPEVVFELEKLDLEWKQLTPGTEEYVRVGKELVGLHTEQLWAIGTVSSVPHPILAKKNLRNVPIESKYEDNFLMSQHPETWFFK